MKPIRRWCVAYASAPDRPWLHRMSRDGETKDAYLQKMQYLYRSQLESMNLRLVRLEIRVVEPRKRKARKGAKKCKP